MAIRLPSGRALHYRGLSFDRYRVEGENGETVAKQSWRYSDPRRNGARVGTYGGHLVAEMTQAIARDLLADALVRLETEGWPVVASVHDEAVVEGAYYVGELCELLCAAPAWAQGLPLAAEGALMERYRKV